MTGDFAATDGTVYVSDSERNSTKTFYTYNAFSDIPVPGSFDGVIAPNQAFYIKTADAEYGSGKTITMSAVNRTNDSSTPSLKSGMTAENNILRLRLSNEHQLIDEAVIALLPEGELVFTRRDSEQRMYTGTNYSFIYSMVEDKKTVINVLPDELVDYQQVLGIEPKKGKQMLTISGIEQFQNKYKIELEDKLTGIRTSMNNGAVYEFEAEEGVDLERLILHFEAKEIDVPTDFDDVDGDESAVKIYIKDHSTLKVSCNWKVDVKTVEIFTVSGSLIDNDEFNGDVYETELNVRPGIYIVKISANNHQFQQKILIR
jgi:hypothetical protein